LVTLQGENIEAAPDLHSKSFVFGHINQENVTRTFSANPARRTLKMRLNFTAKSLVLDTKIMKMRQDLFL